MINPNLVEKILSASSIQRWNDYPRMVSLVELDKQAHKFIIAYFLAKAEENVSFKNLIEAGIFEFLRRVVVTDIRPDVFHRVIEKKTKEINSWVLKELENSLDKQFYSEFERYLNDENYFKKERFILKAASYLSTRWEFSIVYQTSKFLNDIEQVKEAVEAELEDYYELIGVRKIALNQKLARIVDLSGRLRFQKRWAQTQRIPETSVLGHMLVVAILAYFYSIKINACEKRLENNFFCALFHDLPEALTRDIISPVKYSVNGLDDIVNEYEMQKIENEILPFIPQSLVPEFKYLLGIQKSKKDEFANRIYEKNIQQVDTLLTYNENKFNAIDGVALKNCDRLAAYIEAVLSISYGVKSKELVNGSNYTLEVLKEKGKVEGVDFYKLANEIRDNLYHQE